MVVALTAGLVSALGSVPASSVHAGQAAPPRAAQAGGAATASAGGARGPATSGKLRTEWGTPDLRGIWGGRYMFSIDRNAPLLPGARAVMDKEKPEEDPIARCLPPGIPRVMNMNFLIEILQTPKVVYFLLEYDHMVRRVYIDQQHPKDLDPSWLGHSVGHWEGDTLVVDTVGFNDETWLDEQGHPHSEDMRVVERFTRSDDGQALNHEITIDDPTMYRQAWGVKKSYPLQNDKQVTEYVCERSER